MMCGTAGPQPDVQTEEAERRQLTVMFCDLGLCLWRLERFEEAERFFERMLWLNPSDNQGARFLNDDVRARTLWEDREAV